MRQLKLVVVILAFSSSAIAAEKLPGFDSPSLAFQAYMTGAITEDFDLMLSSLTREGKAHHLALSLFSASFLFGNDPAMQKIFREHGIGQANDKAQQRDRPDAQRNEAAEQKAYVDAMLKIKDPGKLMQRIAERHQELAKQFEKTEQANTKVKKPTQREVIASVTLHELKVSDDVATASVKCPASTKEVLSTVPKTVRFLRINKRWFCDIDPR